MKKSVLHPSGTQIRFRVTIWSDLALKNQGRIISRKLNDALVRRLDQTPAAVLQG